MKTIYLNCNNVYLRLGTNNKVDKSRQLPFISFILGVELECKTWIGETAFFKAEDGFVMCGDEYQKFLNSLKKQINDYKEIKLEIYDYYADTDSKLLIDCQKNMIVLKGQLGSTINDDMPVLNFKLRNLNSSFLINFYECLIENTEF